MQKKQKIVDAYNKYAPHNITLTQFEKMIEQDPSLLNDLHGEFSTYNVKLAKALKKLKRTNTESKDVFRQILKDSLDFDSMDQRVKDIAKIYEDIICSNDEILAAAWIFDSLDEMQKQKLAIHIINAINKRLNISDIVSIDYLDCALDVIPKDTFSYGVYSFIRKFFDKFHTKKKYGRYGGYYRNSQGKIVLSYKHYFENFISTLSHEYGHFIDHRYPNMGLLGAQIADYGFRVYESKQGDERYRANPTEVSSFKQGDIISQHLTKILKEQAKKKPELYTKTIQSVIDTLRVKHAALLLKYKKATDEYYDLKQQKRTKLFPSFYSFPDEKQKRIWCEIDQDPRVIELKKKKGDYYDLIFKIREERFPNFFELSDDEQNRILKEIEQDTEVIELKKKREEYYDLIFKIRKERFPDFYDLSDGERDKINKKIEMNPRVKIAKLKSEMAGNSKYWDVYMQISHYENLLEEFQKEQEINNFFENNSR